VREIKNLTDQFGTFTECRLDEPESHKWLTISVPIDNTDRSIKKMSSRKHGGRLLTIDENSQEKGSSITSKKEVSDNLSHYTS